MIEATIIELVEVGTLLFVLWLLYTIGRFLWSLLVAGANGIKDFIEELRIRRSQRPFAPIVRDTEARQQALTQIYLKAMKQVTDDGADQIRRK